MSLNDIQPITPEHEKLNKGARNISQDWGKFHEDLEKSFLLRVKTGYSEIDDNGGIRGLTLIHGAPKSGKSALALQLSYNASLLGNPVIYYSLEVDRQQIITRLISLTSFLNTENEKGITYNGLNESAKNNFIKFSLNDLETNAKNYWDRQDRDYLDLINILEENKNFYLRTTEDGGLPDKQKLDQDISKVRDKNLDKYILIVIDMTNHFKNSEGNDKNEQDINKLNYFLELAQNLDKKVIPILLNQQNKEGQKKGGASYTNIMGTAEFSYSPNTIISLETLEDEKDNIRKLTISGRHAPYTEKNIEFIGKYQAFNLTLKKDNNSYSPEDNFKLLK